MLSFSIYHFSISKPKVRHVPNKFLLVRFKSRLDLIWSILLNLVTFQGGHELKVIIHAVETVINKKKSLID
jgi:hypothetical protein